MSHQFRERERRQFSTIGQFAALTILGTSLIFVLGVKFGLGGGALTKSAAAGGRTFPENLSSASTAMLGAAQVVDPFEPCVPSAPNAIACENSKTGNPASEWDITGAGSANIQGFAADISVNRGETVTFKIDTDAADYRLDIYRLGYYGGLGARKIATVEPSAALPQTQPTCLNDATTGLIDCGNWAPSASWAVPSNATSGIYIAKVVRESGAAGASHIVFIVRDDSGGSDFLFQTSDTTWQAYNVYGGNSLYNGAPAGRAYKVSYNRPFITRDGVTSHDWLFDGEYPMVRWLERNGYNVSYFTGVDSDRRGAEILEHKVFLSVGHDEYWSGNQRTKVEAARNAGVHLAFFSGNLMFWKTRWENSIDGSTTPYRTLVCYKETHANAKIDPNPTEWTGTWRDPRFSPPADGGRPENALTGTIFTVNGPAEDAIKVPEPLGKLRFWRGTSAASQPQGQTATLASGTVGYEWDEDLSNGFRPSGLIRLSTNTVNVPSYLQDQGSTYGPGTATHSLTMYRALGGALVFSAATIRYSWALDNTHDQSEASAIPPANDVIRQATVNLFADMGVQPGTLQAGLTAASQSLDNLAPTSLISSPAAGSNLPLGFETAITGTAIDNGGGNVAAVNVSVDGGQTWSRANGTDTWTFGWTPTTLGPVSIRAMAIDDSGNPQSPATQINVTIVEQGAQCPCSLWTNAATPAVLDEADTSSVEVGVKFQASLDGTITGLRFYKGATNTGVHIGSLWSGAGQLLASATFIDETASGWQQVSLSTPVPIEAEMTYVASYHTTVGHYSVNAGFFASTGLTTGPLTAPASTLVGGNGVYKYGPGGFPTDTFNGGNYWVDVVFTPSPAAPDNTPPTITTFSPGTGATNVNPTTNVTVAFSERIDAGTINANTIELRDPTNALVASTLSYNPQTRTATLDPAATLALSSVYTVYVKGGSADPRVKDLAGNALAAESSWSFTTSATPPGQCPCSFWTNDVTPAVAGEADTDAIEVGLKFRADVGGTITGLRFYKGAANTGVHVGNLWTSTGELLASATFENETASGWQQVSLSTPVLIEADAIYVASYHTNVGRYSVNAGFFASAGLTAGPLTAPSTSVAGGNGVFKYGPGGFPTDSFNGGNYWVDVVFMPTPVGPDTAPPSIVMFRPGAGAENVFSAANVTARFSENMDPMTINGATVELRDSTNAVVASTVNYNIENRTATLNPTANLTLGGVYTVHVKGGTTDPRVKDLAGNAMAAESTWSFTVAPPYQPTGPGGRILVITSTGNKFTQYYQEILLSEGFNSYKAIDIAQIDENVLSQYDVAILGEMALTAGQVTTLSDWVTGGGNLIAMRPDKQLASLLGLTDAASTRADAYLQIDVTKQPGAGIVGQPIQYHSDADLYSLTGATAVATIFSDPNQATLNPAVTIRSVGANGGQAAAFTFDLARSIVYTRQGNPAYAGQERDGSAPVRPNDQFYPDYVNLDKVAIPQADELQRLLGNMLQHMNSDKSPLPRFWYLPSKRKAVILMAGDDHGTPTGTKSTFDALIAQSPQGCSVGDWECYRATSYLYTSSPLTDAEALAYKNQGFDIGIHVNTNCADWTPTSLEGFFTDELASFSTKYYSLAPQIGSRTHCVAWSDWASQAKEELTRGIRIDQNYYYWPGSWVQNRPGFMNGSGFPMRFADLDGSTIDVYQAATHLVNENGVTYPAGIFSMLDKALGPEGYYGVFGTHYDHTDTFDTQLRNAAVSRNVALISAQQLLTWLDGRNSSAFGATNWDGTTLEIPMSVAPGAANLFAMVPMQVGAVSLVGINFNGEPTTFTVETIKGRSYAFFPAASGTATVTYSQDLVAPTVQSVTPADQAVDASISTNIAVAFSERMDADTINSQTIKVLDPQSAEVVGTVTYNAASNTASFDPTSNLLKSTVYTVQVRGGVTPPQVKDAAGNALAASFNSTFTTQAQGDPVSLWSDATIPATPGVNDPGPVELGLKFRSDIAGQITAIRFYKSLQNTGPHVVSIWSEAGGLLAQATSTTETASGWQTVMLTTPVNITANTTYVASYFAANGFYAVNSQYFSAAEYSNGVLHALQNGVSGGNGLYAYGPAPLFPTNSFNASNYWVDVVFRP